MTPASALHWVALPVLLPLLAAFLVFLFPRHGRAGAWVTGAGVFLSLLMLISGVMRNGVHRYPLGGWGAPLGIELHLDGLSAFMLLTTTIVYLCVLAFSGRYLVSRHWMELAGEGKRYFWALILLLWGTLNALFLSGDLFNLYICLELLTLAAVASTALGGGREAVVASLRYLVISLLGSFCYLLGVALLYGRHGALDIVWLGALVEPGPYDRAALSLMAAGLMAKTALFPLHFWLPPAHANAPAPVSALLSGLVVKASFYLLVRLWFDVFPGAGMEAAALLPGALGAGAVLWCSWQAIRQERLKMMLAYSTAAQLGYLFLLFPLASNGGGFAAWGGALYLVLAHACAKAAMFLGAGVVVHALGHDRLEDFHGLARRMPVTVFTFALAGISLMGLPPSGGFVAKWLLLEASLVSGQWWYALAILLGSLLAAVYVFRLLSPTLVQYEAQAGHGVEKTAPAMIWPAFVLSVTAVVLGLMAPFILQLLEIGAPAHLLPARESP